MTPEQMAEWLKGFVDKNGPKMTDVQRLNFELIAQTLLTQKLEIEKLRNPT